MPTSIKTFFDEKVPAVLKTSPEKVKDVAAVYLFKITGDDGGTWTVDLVSSPPTCKSRASTARPSARSKRATPTSAGWSTAACRRRCRCSSAAS